MMIDTNTIVSMSEANQNFSKVARMAQEFGSVTILKNNHVAFILNYVPQDDSISAASDDVVLASSKKFMKRNKHIYKELAK